MPPRNGININWGGLREALHRGTSQIADTQNLMTQIGAAMKGHTKRRFQNSVDPEGKAWEELARPRKNKKGKKTKGKPLVDTGRLRESVSFSATALEVHVGSNLTQARIHQLGGEAGPGRKITIPARPYLGLSEEDQEEIAALVADHLAGSFS